MIGTASNKTSRLANEIIAMPFDGGLDGLADPLVDSGLDGLADPLVDSGLDGLVDPLVDSWIDVLSCSFDD